MAAASSTPHLDDDLRIAVMRLARRMRLERGGSDVTDGQLSALFVLAKHGRRVSARSATSSASHRRR